MTHLLLMLSADWPDVPPELPPELRAVLMAMAVRDRGTYTHMRRVGFLVDRLADWMGLSEEVRLEVAVAALLHDIGKLGIPEALLNKAGRLSDGELRELATHAEVGAAMLLRIGADAGVARLVLHHHEFLDGSGYPRCLRGDEIPLGARLIAVADAYDSMTTARSYRPGLSSDLALTEIDRCSGSQFDPTVAVAFGAMIRQALADGEQWAQGSGDDPAATVAQPIALRLGAVRRLRAAAHGPAEAAHTG